MSRRSRRSRLPQGEFEAEIETLSQEGRGVTHIDGKAVFIDGALPGEKVRFHYVEKNRRYDVGAATQVMAASPHRVEPGCPHFDRCGGCSLQHLDARQQIIFKQQSMLEGLQHIAHIEPENLLAPLTATVWGYRRKARLGVRYVQKKGRVLVGFREKHSGFIADLTRCDVLHPTVGLKVAELAEFLSELDARASIAQIEVAVSEGDVALVFRHLEPLSAADRARFEAFEQAQALRILLQPKGPDSVVPLTGEPPTLFYTHPDYGLRVDFEALDFFQVNGELNRQMVPQALALLDVGAHDRVLDLFCGLGNFTLPLARHAHDVVGVEGDAAMVARARSIARANRIENTRYYVANLMGSLEDASWLNQRFDKILLDPPRSGAKEVITHFGRFDAARIVYVSCHPGSLARDAGTLVHTHGYRLTHAGVMDMFPHTAHVESIAVFER